MSSPPCSAPLTSTAGVASDRGHAGSRLGFAVAIAVVLFGAMLVLVAGAAQAFAGAELVTLDGDSLYHLRRMRLVAEAFPRVPWIDPLIAWPDGAPIPWAAGLDLLGAAAIVAGRALGGPAAGDLWVAALCPVLGVLLVAATMELVHALLRGAPARRSAALAAGILAAAVPQGLAIARFGRIDHHVAEALAMVLLARWAIAVLPPLGERSRGARLAVEGAGAAISAGAVAVFTGSPLYVAVALPILLAGSLGAARSRLLGSGGPGLVAGAALSALASAPAVAVHGRAFAFGFPSLLQPALLAAAGAAVCAAALVSGRVAPGWRRLGILAAIPAAVAVVAAAAAPQGATQVVAGIREWLLRQDPWLASIDEFQPLLRDPRGPATAVNRFFGALGFAFPVLLPCAVLGVRAAAGRWRAGAFLWVTAALAGLALHESRFGRVFAPFLAACAALAVAWLVDRAAARLRAGGRRVAVAAPVAVALAVAVVDPRVRAAAFEGADGAGPDAAIEAALDLRARGPGAGPGVQAPWDLANPMLVIAGRPVVATGFGPYPDPQAYWEGVKAYTVGEGELLPWLAGRRIGWVVAGAANLFGRVSSAGATIPFSGRGFSPAWLAETPSAPLLIGGSGVPGLGVRHLGHLLPVFASTRTVGGIDGRLPVLWTYEVVPGARVHGRASPGARVILEVPLEEHGRPHTWRAFADAEGDGRWSMTVPLPTDLATATVTTRPGLLRIGAGEPVPVRVPEAAVRAGSDIAVDAPAIPPRR